MDIGLFLRVDADCKLDTDGFVISFLSLFDTFDTRLAGYSCAGLRVSLATEGWVVSLAVEREI